MLISNKYIKRSRISEVKFREFVKFFALDLDAYKIALLTGLNRNTALAPFPLVGPLVLVKVHILIQINLQGFQIRVNFLSKGNPVKFIKNGLMNPFTNTVGLGTSDLCLCMIYVV